MIYWAGLWRPWLSIIVQYIYVFYIFWNKKEQNVCIDTNFIWHFKGNHSKAKSHGGLEFSSNWYDKSTYKYINKGNWLMANEITFHKAESLYIAILVFLPNFIRRRTAMSILRPNLSTIQSFVEEYLVGLNHQIIF